MFILFVFGVVLLSFITLLFLLTRWRAIGQPVVNNLSNTDLATSLNSGAPSNLHNSEKLAEKLAGFQPIVLDEKPVGIDDSQWAVLVKKRDEIEDDPLIDQATREAMRQQWFLTASQVFHRAGSDRLQIISRPLKTFPWVVFFLVVSIVSCAVYIYVGNWTPQALAFSTQNRVGHVDQSMPSGSDRHPGGQLSMQERIESLQARLAQQPDDLMGWALLSRAKASQRDFAGSVAALEKALALAPGHPDILVDMADMVAMTQNNQMRGRPLDLVMQALESDPNNPKALALAATAAEQLQDQAMADKYWSKLRKIHEIQQLEQAEKNTSATGLGQNSGAAIDKSSTSELSDAKSVIKKSAISGTVTLSATLQAKLKTLPSSAVLYITAKALEGSPMPLAVLRFPVSVLQSGTVSFSLDDSTAMAPQMKISSHEKVNLEARISISGQALKASGDWAKTLAGVRVGESGVQLLIDTVLSQ